jgi:hypothetical protein
MATSPSYTLVICSCDVYADAWGPLFTLFAKYWPTLNAPIVLNTETATYEHPPLKITCPQLYRDHPRPASVPWSKRLRETLENHVQTELVLIFLDDFYLRSPVDDGRLEQCAKYMLAHPDVGNIALFPCPGPTAPVSDAPWLSERSKRAPYLFNLQAGLWRTARLRHFIRDHESPWYFERWGSFRGRRYPDRFLTAVHGASTGPLFDYHPSHEGLSKGKWLPQTPELFRREGICLDLSLRGVMPVGWRARRPSKWRLFRSAWNIFRSLRP